MTADDTYSVDFQGLTPGKHRFEFKIEDSLFSLWEESEVQHGEGKIVITLMKHPGMLEVETVIAAKVKLTCDRCLEEFLLPVNFQGSLVVKITDEEIDEEPDGDVMWLKSNEDKLRLAQYFYESIILSLPYQRVHPDIKDCNQEMLKRFRIVTPKEFEQIEQSIGTQTIEEDLAENEPEELEKLQALKQKMEKGKESKS